MKALLRREGFEDNVRPFLAGLARLDHHQLNATVAAIENGGIDVEGEAGDRATVIDLARAGFVEIACAGGAVTLTPVREDFALPGAEADLEASWRASRFLCIQVEGGTLVASTPLGPCKAKLHDPQALHFLHALASPASGRQAAEAAGLGNRAPGVLGALAHAGLVLPCDADGRTEEDIEPHRRQWDFHELLFHARSRLGRSGMQVGATWQFRGDIPEPPAVRENPWADRAIPLYRPAILSRDMSLWDAMESRRSIRSYSALPLSSMELGEFLWRTMRIRSRIPTPEGELISRPYPNGGGLYEQELYVTIDACADIPRGFYYYDALQHALCHVREPDADMAMLIEEAVNATGRSGHPQILFTIASRFDRFNWKYSAMAYAAQLKNVGVIYQTMYLVATAMGLGACALGLGNSDRFARMSGRDWLEEGSIGEFMIGRPR
jgi:oxazoline/thiazoline dehydrogenase